MLDSVFVPNDIDRPALEAEAQALAREVSHLTAAINAGGDIPVLVDELKSTNARLNEVRGRLAPQESQNREELRAALEQRVAEWRTILRSNPQRARQVIQHLVGQIWLWRGAPGDMDTATRARPDDRRGTTNIGLDDVVQRDGDVIWRAAVQEGGLLIGLPGFAGRILVQRVASPGGTTKRCKLDFSGVAA